MKHESLKHRLLANVEINPRTDCWLWIGKTNKKGYGYISMRTGKNHPSSKRVHRVSFELFKGRIPKGYDIDHRCRNRRCINPEHLDAVTHKENCKRRVIRQRLKDGSELVTYND